MNLILPKHFMVQQHLDNSGYMTLLSVLIVSALATSIAVSLLWLGLGSSKTSFALEQSNQAKGLANACAEYALGQVRDDSNYAGSGSLTLGAGSCNYQVVNTGDENRNIQSYGIVGAIIRKVEVDINNVSSQINILSWQEVGDF